MNAWQGGGKKVSHGNRGADTKATVMLALLPLVPSSQFSLFYRQRHESKIEVSSSVALYGSAQSAPYTVNQSDCTININNILQATQSIA